MHELTWQGQETLHLVRQVYNEYQKSLQGSGACMKDDKVESHVRQNDELDESLDDSSHFFTVHGALGICYLDIRSDTFDAPVSCGNRISPPLQPKVTCLVFFTQMTNLIELGRPTHQRASMG